MSERKRINLSFDPESYEELTKLQKEYGFASLCEMLSALTHLAADRIRKPKDRIFDLPDDDAAVIDGMFRDLRKKARTTRPNTGGRPKKTANDKPAADKTTTRKRTTKQEWKE